MKTLSLLIALVVLVIAFILMITTKIGIWPGALIASLAVSILLSSGRLPSS